MDKVEIPRKSIYRLSIYQRCLQALRENEVSTVSSGALAKAAGQYRFQLMMRAPSTKLMTAHLKKVIAVTTMPEDVILTIDVDPIYLG